MIGCDIVYIYADNDEPSTPNYKTTFNQIAHAQKHVVCCGYVDGGDANANTMNSVALLLWLNDDDGTSARRLQPLDSGRLYKQNCPTIRFPKTPAHKGSFFCVAFEWKKKAKRLSQPDDVCQ